MTVDAKELIGRFMNGFLLMKLTDVEFDNLCRHLDIDSLRKHLMCLGQSGVLLGKKHGLD